MASSMPFHTPALPGKPWRTPSELAMVRDWFYPRRAILDPYSIPDGDIRQIAIDKVRVYAYSDQRTPHALVATAFLSEALFVDESETGKKLGNVAMGSVFGMAWVRFVGGFVDRDVVRGVNERIATDGNDVEHVVDEDEDEDDDDEDMASAEDESSDDGEDDNVQGTRRFAVKGGGESSMYAFAANIGMPESFVDLRHQIVHGQMPQLSLLRQKTKEGLEWLWEKWWKVHATGDSARALRLRENEAMEKEEAREQGLKMREGDEAESLTPPRRPS